MYGLFRRVNAKTVERTTDMSNQIATIDTINNLFSIAISCPDEHFLDP
jgi:hypothetical protein